MKRIFYKGLLPKRLGLSASERIVFSCIVYHALANLDDVWDKESGKFDELSVKEYGDTFELPSHFFNYEDKFCFGVTISKRTGVSQPTVSRAIKKLCELGYLDFEKKLVYHQYIYTNGYFELVENVKLSGELLIFYSWLIDIKGDGHIIFASRDKLASLYHVQMQDVRDYIKRLKELDLVERDKRNNQLIIK